jgi:DNA replication and repair protein RecF
MHLADLALTDFRSHQQLRLGLEPGVTTFVGGNGQGKTNLVEAVAYLATLSSHRVATNLPLVRQGEDRALIKVKLVRGERSVVVTLEIRPGKSNRAFLGRAAVKPTALLGVTRAVSFVPEDLELVKAGPDHRRRYLDQLLVQIRPSLAGVIADYDKVNHQRSALLKSLGALNRVERQHSMDSLEVWNQQAAQLGGRVTASRMALVADLFPLVARVYEELSGQGSAELAYNPSVDLAGRPTPEVAGEAYLEAMDRLRSKEMERGATLVGPHREDLQLTLGGFPARGYASHGESWSLALALRLGAFQVIRQDCGDDPILILDDVFAELDANRRQALAQAVDGAEQVLVTAAVKNDVPSGLTTNWHHFQDGRVTASE